MPELAEVEYYRRQWDPGIDHCVIRVSLHERSRVLREMDPELLVNALTGRKLLESAAHGKQMLFRFSNGLWLGLHLGMTGSLQAQAAGFRPGRHDHLVLHQAKRALVFNDPRQFGRVRFHQGASAPEWWSALPPALNSSEFTLSGMREFLKRHSRLPIKSALLLQEGFPGVGNWMADEILWRAKLNPKAKAGALNEFHLKLLWKTIRFVCRGALRHIAPNFSDPPQGWLINERWTEGGRCPRDRTVLKRESIGARTTAWCPRCQA